MAAATPAQIKDRIVTLCGQVSGIITVQDDWPESNNPFTPAQLPAIVVSIGRANNQWQSGTSFIMSRPYYLNLVSQRIEEDSKDPDTTALETIEPFLISIPLFFCARPRLENLATGDAGLALSTSLPSDTGGVGRFIRNGGNYRGTMFILTVDTRYVV